MTEQLTAPWPPPGVQWYYSDAAVAIACGDCLDVMRTMEANSVDAVVTDPPAGISFMSKDWDHNKGGRDSWIAWMQTIAVEALRVIKPGGHALVWAIPRTSHWTGMAWENAGWVCRDKIYHATGSGFPKSLDIGKTIDKHGGVAVAWFGPWFRKWREENSVTQKQVASLFPSKTGGFTGCVANWELGFNMPTPDQFNLIRDTFGLPFASVEEAEREVVGVRENAMSGWDMDGGTKFVDRAITAPATDAARQWSGWGTALKPAIEEWWLFRRPLDKCTVAENVLRWGCGGINVDGCRIGSAGNDPNSRNDKHGKHKGEINADKAVYSGAWKCMDAPWNGASGRFPSHLTHDGSDEVVGCFPVTTSPTGTTVRKYGAYKTVGGASNHRPCHDSGLTRETVNGFGDSGSAARFFQCCPPDPLADTDAKRLAYFSKAAKSDRDEGCEGMEERRGGSLNMRTDAHSQANDMDTGPRRNFHPTVKSVSLMRYLCRLITPPNGIVLDPFAGSGSTGKGAVREFFRFIGIERDRESVDLAVARCKDAGRERQEVLAL